MNSTLQYAAREVATDAYTLRTLAIRDDSFIAVTSGMKRLHKPDAERRAL